MKQNKNKNNIDNKLHDNDTSTAKKTKLKSIKKETKDIRHKGLRTPPTRTSYKVSHTYQPRIRRC